MRNLLINILFLLPIISSIFIFLIAFGTEYEDLGSFTIIMGLLFQIWVIFKHEGDR